LQWFQSQESLQWLSRLFSHTLLMSHQVITTHLMFWSTFTSMILTFYFSYFSRGRGKVGSVWFSQCYVRRVFSHFTCPWGLRRGSLWSSNRRSSCHRYE
jgi:hypothetical protein